MYENAVRALASALRSEVFKSPARTGLNAWNQGTSSKAHKS